jgi:hypothetical protein
MAHTVSAAVARLVDHMGWGTMPTALSGISLCNEAGHYLSAMRKWEWQGGRSALLNTVAGQDYVSLPADYGGLRAQTATGTRAIGLDLVTLEAVLLLRENGGPTGSSWPYVGAEVWQQGSGAPLPRLELYPTPPDSEAGKFTIFYWSTWADVSDDNALLPIPDEIFTLYLQVLFAIARGYAEDDEGTMDQRLEAVKQGALYAAMSARFARSQPSFGRMGGGLVAQAKARRYGWRPNLLNTVDPPA